MIGNTKTGNIVSLWNANKFNKNGEVIVRTLNDYSMGKQWGIVNGNSVNFAKNTKEFFEAGVTKHKKYDMNTVNKFDPPIRNNIHNNWVSPVRAEDVDDGNENPNHEFSYVKLTKIIF